ncbi:MAG TPA: decarboxylating 6-phosphogluconate dehydrogenase [Burkholderiales bacterium]|nr:decarboxylating 6-phosphogluconate dehydrogenase [Burkholderiales bacterium]
MLMGMIGLGRMGGNMAARLLRGGIEVVGFDRSREAIARLASDEGLLPSESVEDLASKLSSPRIIWIMLPSGEITESQIGELSTLLSEGDIVIDGGNSNYRDSVRRGKMLASKGIGFMDAGTSGGIWGLENGYCLMVGAEPEVASQAEPLLKILAPSSDSGWAHVGPIGSGHFVKMVHNGIEYGMMQAIAEGFALMESKREFSLDLAQIAEIWRHGSVVRSWLLDLSADALKSDQKLENIVPYVADSGEGRWTAIEAIEQGVAAPVLSLALQMRFASQDDKGYGYRLLAMMRNAFGGHALKEKHESH